MKKKPNERYIGVEEMMELLGGASKSTAYKIIAMFNDELRTAGKITLAGRVSRPYALDRLGLSVSKRK